MFLLQNDTDYTWLHIFDVILFVYARQKHKLACGPSEGKEMQEGSRGEGEEGKLVDLALGKLHQ